MKFHRCMSLVKMGALVVIVFQVFLLFTIMLFGEFSDDKKLQTKGEVFDTENRASYLGGQVKVLDNSPLLEGGNDVNDDVSLHNNQSKKDPSSMVDKIPKPEKEKNQKNMDGITEEEFYKMSPTKINPYLYNYNSSSLPHPAKCSPQTYMLVLVHSRPDYIDKRNAIRDTWGKGVAQSIWPSNQGINHLDVEMKLLFVVAQIPKNMNYNQKSLQQEAEEHQDIIQGDFVDSYKNMTLKSLLGLKWTIEQCQGVQFLLKSDDDMFIYLPGILERLQKVNTSKTILGPYNVGSKVYRKGKWGISFEDFPFPFYPPYESGSAYIFTGDAVQPLFNASKYVKPIFIDDVYVTGILGKLINVHHAGQGGFAWSNSKKPVVCSFLSGTLLTGIKVTPGYMRELWTGMGTVEKKQCIKN